MSEPLYDRIGFIGGGVARLNDAPPTITKPGTGGPSHINRLGDMPVVTSLSTVFGKMALPGQPPGSRVDKGIIDAMVTMQGRPVARPVWVLDQRGVIIAKTTSDEDGRYLVEGLDKAQRYIVLSLDVPERKYNAAISDYVQPE